MEKEMNIKTTPSKLKILAFRIVTAILVIGMLSGGLSTFIKIEYQVNLFNHLGFPLFLMTLIGMGKILAAIVLVLPGIPLLKIGAYVGTFIVSVCAFASHIVASDTLVQIMSPLTLMTIVLAACFLNPYIKVVSTGTTAKHT